MAKENSSCLWPIAIIVVAIGVYYGFFKPKEGATIGDMATGSGIEVDTRCVGKKIDGEYSLSVIYEKSKNRLFEIQKMELQYDFAITRNGCDITGKGKKLGYSVVDTLNSSPKRKALSRDEKDVEITGEIKNATLNLIVSFVTKSADDNRVVLTFPFTQNEITKSLDGTFIENKSSSSGTAKLRRRND
jgi:hypothetical protein